MPLTLANPGTPVSIQAIRGRDRTRMFLESLGFVVGSNVTVVSELGNNIIINVKDTRIALDKDMAGRILVSSIQ